MQTKPNRIVLKSTNQKDKMALDISKIHEQKNNKQAFTIRGKKTYKKIFITEKHYNYVKQMAIYEIKYKY